MSTANQRVMLVDAESSVEANVDPSGYLEVSIKAGGGTGGTAMADDAAFTAGTTSGTPVGGYAGSDTVDANDFGVFAIDTDRNLKISIEADNAGIGGGTQYTEDDAVPANPVGNALLVERDDALGGLTPAAGDWTQLFCDANGALWTHDDALDACISGSELQVDVVASLPAGTNAIGKLAANSGVDIGDVDILSIAAGDNNIGNVDIVTHPSDTFAADAQAYGKGVLCQGDDGTDRRAILVGTDGHVQVDVLSAPSTAVTNAGTFVVQEDGAALTALQLIDDAVYVDDADWTDTTSKHLLVGGLYQSSPQTITDGDVGPFQVDANGRIIANVYSASGLEVVQDTAADLNVTEASAATIAGDTTSIDGKITACNTGAVTISAALPAGTNAIGKLAANDGVDIGNVDVASIAAGDNNIGNVDIASALPAGTNAIGKLAANSGVDIGDVDVTSITGVTMSNAGMQITGDEAHDAADAGNPIKFGGRAQDCIGAEPEEVADNDRVDALFDTNGRLGVFAGSDYKYADINDATSGDNTIIAAQGVGKRIAVWAILIVSDGTADVRWEDGAAGTAFTGQVPLQAREGYSIAAGGLVPLFVGSANTLLNLELSAAVNQHGFVSYTVLDD